jgi:hypothetical protein
VPEEFRQVGWQLLPQPKSTVQSIDLHVRTYSHPSYKIVLTHCFLPAFPPSRRDIRARGHDSLPRAADFVSSLLGFVPELEDTEKSTIVGSLVRQIVFDLNGRHMTRSIALGDAKMTSRPPGAVAVFDAHEASLDWDGEVRCTLQPAFHGNECLPGVTGLHRARAQAAVRRDVL